MTEKRMRSIIVKMLEPLGAFSVENVAHPGTPDISTVRGWIELKVCSRPMGGGRVAMGIRPAQRVWFQRWGRSRGRAWLITLLDDDTWFIHEGESVKYLGYVSEKDMRDIAVKVWDTRIIASELIDALLRG